MSVTIYHNPDCGTSRNTLAMIRQSGVEPTVIEYLKTPPSRERLKELISAMGISARALLREKGTPYRELGLSACLEERTIEYVRSESFSSFDAFVDRVTAADRSRLDIVREKRSEVLGAFENNATSFGNQAFVLEQPSKAYFFRK